MLRVTRLLEQSNSSGTLPSLQWASSLDITRADSGRKQGSPLDNTREKTREDIIGQTYSRDSKDRFDRSDSQDCKEDSKSGSDTDNNVIWRRRRNLRGHSEAMSDTKARVPTQEADECKLTLTVDTPGNGDNVNNFSALDRPFPFTNAQYITQTDILDDGLPPVPRAIAAQRHLEVMVLVKEVNHLPQRDEDLDLEQTFYCVNMTINNELFQTDPRRGNHFFGCKWYERFDVNVPESVLRDARQAFFMDELGPVFSLSLYDSGKYSAKSALGQADVPVKDILDVVEEGLIVSVRLKDTSGDDVIGADGEITCIHLTFRTLLANLQQEWVPPTVEETLASCDEQRIKLNPGRKPFSLYGPEVDNNSSGWTHHRRSTFLSNIVPLGHSVTEISEASNHEVSNFTSTILNENEVEIEDLDKEIDFHWRERLETVLDSLSVNLIVIVLVIIDIFNIVLFTIAIPSPEDQPDPLASFVLSVLVIGCLFIELTLRQLAMGRRFWKSKFNIFDALIIYLSASIFVVRQVVRQSDIQQLQGFVTLRALRAIAVALRVVRVLVNLSRARKLSGHAVKKLRSTVSQNKRRYNKHGFDLDLTYITNRIIAMGTPAFGKHSSYRNDIHVVSRFMAFKHYGCFFIFNFCDTYNSSDGMTGNYNPDMLFNQVQRVPFEDHGPPLMSEMMQFCEEAQLWLLKDSCNVVALHCKGGKVCLFSATQYTY